MTAAQKKHASLKAKASRRRLAMEIRRLATEISADNAETLAYMDRLDREQPGWMARLFRLGR